MNLLRFLLQSSRTIVIVSSLAGAAAGVAGIALIALIQRELARDTHGTAAVVWAFVALCLVSASRRLIAQVSMLKLGQGAVAKLSLHVVRRTLELALPAFEAINTSGLLAGAD